MSGGANIVEQYAGADVPAKIELLIKYYPNFIRLAYELDIKPEALKMQMCRIKKVVCEQTSSILIRKYQHL